MPAPRRGARSNSSRPTLPDVAAKAGVSVGTVSHVLNHPDRVSAETRDKVTAAINELEFSRNSMASALASGSTRTIGLVVPTLRNSLFVDIAEGAQHAAKANGLMLQLASSDSDQEQQQVQLGFLDGARVSGLLLAPMQDSQRIIERLRRHGRPVVVINYASPDAAVCTVLIDNEEVGYLAARHLIDLGRKRIAFVAARYDLQPVVLRREGARRAAAEAGEEVQFTEITVDGLDAPDGAVAGQRIIDQGQRRVDGVVAVTDMLGMAIIQQLIGAQLAVPQDVAIIGCDYNSGAWGGAIPLSSVTMRGETLGERAVQLLMEEINGESPPHQHQVVTLQPELVIRESTVGR